MDWNRKQWPGGVVFSLGVLVFSLAVVYSISGRQSIASQKQGYDALRLAESIQEHIPLEKPNTPPQTWLPVQHTITGYNPDLVNPAHVDWAFHRPGTVKIQMLDRPVIKTVLQPLQQLNIQNEDESPSYTLTWTQLEWQGGEFETADAISAIRIERKNLTAQTDWALLIRLPATTTQYEDRDVYTQVQYAYRITVVGVTVGQADWTVPSQQPDPLPSVLHWTLGSQYAGVNGIEKLSIKVQRNKGYRFVDEWVLVVRDKTVWVYLEDDRGKRGERIELAYEVVDFGERTSHRNDIPFTIVYLRIRDIHSGVETEWQQNKSR